VIYARHRNNAGHFFDSELEQISSNYRVADIGLRGPRVINMRKLQHDRGLTRVRPISFQFCFR